MSDPVPLRFDIQEMGAGEEESDLSPQTAIIASDGTTSAKCTDSSRKSVTEVSGYSVQYMPRRNDVCQPSS